MAKKIIVEEVYKNSGRIDKNIVIRRSLINRIKTLQEKELHSEAITDLVIK